MIDAVTLDIKDIALNALEAYEAKRLGFQSIARLDMRQQYYYPDGGVCAIGASFKKHRIDIPEEANTWNLDRLFRWGIPINFTDARTITIQRDHDNCVIGVQNWCYTFKIGTDERLLEKVDRLQSVRSFIEKLKNFSV